jgi:hypothetical protein
MVVWRRSTVSRPRRLQVAATPATGRPLTAPEIRLGRREPNSVAPAVFAIVERGCMMRPELGAGLRCCAELRLSDGYPAVRLTFAETAIFVEDAPPDEPSADPPGRSVSLDELRAGSAGAVAPAGTDPMLDTGVRMASFKPDVVVKGRLTEIMAIVAMPTFLGIPDLTDRRGRSAVATIAAGRVRFRGNLLRARQLIMLLQI